MPDMWRCFEINRNKDKLLKKSGDYMGNLFEMEANRPRWKADEILSYYMHIKSDYRDGWGAQQTCSWCRDSRRMKSRAKYRWGGGGETSGMTLHSTRQLNFFGILKRWLDRLMQIASQERFYRISFWGFLWRNFLQFAGRPVSGTLCKREWRWNFKRRTLSLKLRQLINKHDVCVFF